MARFRRVAQPRATPDADRDEQLRSLDWDEYWRNELKVNRRRHRDRNGTSPFRSLVAGLSAPWRRVLVVGCGTSIEPALLTKLGYQVVAFDVSGVAISFLESNPPTDAELAHFLTLEIPWSAWKKLKDGSLVAPEGDDGRRAHAEALARLSRPGGSLELRRCDFRELRADGAFDVVYSPWSWQCLPSEGRALLVSSAAGWLAPGGGAFFAVQNLPASMHSELTSACTAAGLLRRHEIADGMRQAGWPQNADEWERDRERCEAEDVAMLAKLRDGAKMWDVYNASG